jgi:hypothetical protein
MDQRKSKRFELRLPMELVRSGASAIGKVTETRNVSSGGVLFASDSQLPIGQPLEYVLTLPSGDRGNGGVKIHCMGTIVRMETRPENGTRSGKDRPFNVAATLDRYEFVR